MKKNQIKKISALLLAAVTAGVMMTGCSELGNININYNDTEDIEDTKEPSKEESTDPDKAELEYWTEDSKAAASLKEYVEAVTDKDSNRYIPVEDRIAVFDMDGTLLCELFPASFEEMMFIHRALYDESFDAPKDLEEYALDCKEKIDAGELDKLNFNHYQEYLGKAYGGMTPAELEAYTREFMSSDADGFNNLKRGDAFYKPMVSLVNYLTANDFTCYVISGTERTVIRELIKDTLPVPDNHVIGSSFAMVASGQGDTPGIDYQYTEDDEVIISEEPVIVTLKMNKVSQIAQEIGKVPVLAFGNSSGDMSMAQYTVNNKEYDSRAYMVLCDDYEREYGSYESWKPLADYCEEHGFETISMCDDFATIYGDDVTLNREADNVIFDITMPEELDGTYVIESRKNGYLVFDKEAKDADFGGFAFSVYAYESPEDYAGGMDKKVGEIRDGEDTLFDIVIEYPSDVQFDYTVYQDGMPKSYEALYDGAEDIVKTLAPKGGGEFIWGAGCKGEDLYSDIIEKYVTAVEEKWDSNKLEKEDMSPEYNAINVATGGDAIDNVGYAYRDVNNDGVDELLIGEIAQGDLKGTVYDIYTIVDREPVHVLSGTARDRYYALEYGMIINERSGGADDTEWQSYDIEPNTTNLLPQLGVKKDGYEDKDNPWFVNFGSEDEWEKISEDEFNDYKSRFDYVRIDFTPLANVS